jgi:hypothetical protein
MDLLALPTATNVVDAACGSTVWGFAVRGAISGSRRGKKENPK